MMEFSWSTSMGDEGSRGRYASASMRKLGQSSEVWVPRINLWTARSPPSDEGCSGSHWTVREGHSREWHITRSYSNGVFFFQTENSSSTTSSISLSLSLSLSKHTDKHTNTQTNTQKGTRSTDIFPRRGIICRRM